MENDYKKLSFELSEQYFKTFKNIIDELKKPAQKIKNDITASAIILNMEKKKSLYDETFSNILIGKDVLYYYYKKAAEKFEDGQKVNILETGLKLVGKLLLFYCIKDENEEFQYMTNIKNFEEIDYDFYQKDFEYLDSKSNHSSKNISGLKVRAFTLETLIYFYIKKIGNLVELPNLIFNLNKKNFLFREFDGVFFNDSENPINLQNIRILIPFNKDLTINVNKNKIIDSHFILAHSLIIIEAKMHFPKENTKNKLKNFSQVIEEMFEKLELYLEIINDFPYKFTEIQLMLFYDQNKINNYKEENIKNYILSGKKKLNIKALKYNIFFQIIYVFPSIGKMSLSLIEKEFKEMKEEYKNIINKMKEEYNKMKEEYNKMKEENNLKITELQNQINQIVNELKKEREDNNLKIIELKVENKNLKNYIDQLKETNKNLQSKNKNLTKKEEDKININNNNIIKEITDKNQNGKKDDNNKTKNPNYDELNEINDKIFVDILKRKKNNNTISKGETAYYQLTLLCLNESRKKKLKFAGLDKFSKSHYLEMRTILHSCFSNLTKELQESFGKAYKFTPCLKECPFEEFYY